MGWRAVTSVRAVHEGGDEVTYSRYSVSFRGGGGQLTLGAELDDDGVLLIHAPPGIDAAILERIDDALRSLDVSFRHE